MGDIFFTARQTSDVIQLLDKYNYNYKITDSHFGTDLKSKIIGQILRMARLLVSIPEYDVALSHGCSSSTHLSNILGKPSISITDNDGLTLDNRLYLSKVDYLLVPTHTNSHNFIKMGVNPDKIYTYSGFKENLYIADYEPDKDFLDNLPFNDYVLIRPEALSAEYVKNRKSLSNDLIKMFLEYDYNILYLPRSKDNYIPEMALNREKVYIPPKPLNGLDLCYYSKGVLTGSGTFAREAACMGIPSVSFFPHTLLGVDNYLVKKGSIFHSRNPKKIREHIENSEKREPDIDYSKRVKEELQNLVESIVSKL